MVTLTVMCPYLTASNPKGADPDGSVRPFSICFAARPIGTAGISGRKNGRRTGAETVGSRGRAKVAALRAPPTVIRSVKEFNINRRNLFHYGKKNENNGR